MSIGQIIKQYRRVKNMSQLELAEKIGCSQGAVASYETGRREPDLDAISRLEAALGLQPGTLFLGWPRSNSNEPRKKSPGGEPRGPTEGIG